MYPRELFDVVWLPPINGRVIDSRGVLAKAPLPIVVSVVGRSAFLMYVPLNADAPMTSILFPNLTVSRVEKANALFTAATVLMIGFQFVGEIEG